MILFLPKKWSDHKGFTLIEILIVVGIISLLAVALLSAINPAEAQRKARDAQRLKDLATLQSAIDQYINDKGVPNANADTVSISNVLKRSCAATGWFGFDVCSYVNGLPVDPQNGKSTGYIKFDGTKGTGVFQYKANITTTGEYAISAHLESTANLDKLKSDGNADDFFSVFSNASAVAGSQW